MPHGVDRLAQKFDRMGNDNESSLERSEVITQPQNRIVVEMIGRLVKQKIVRTGKQNPGEFDPSALAAGKRTQRLVEDSFGQAQRGRHLRRLRICSPSPGIREFLVEANIALHRLDLARTFGFGHLPFGFANAFDRLIDSANREDPIACRLIEIPLLRVLRKISDRALAIERSGRFDDVGRHTLAGHEPHERRLSCPVAPNEAHAHSFVYSESGVDDEFAGSDAHGEVFGVDHPISLLENTPGHCATQLCNRYAHSMSMNENIQLDASRVKVRGRGAVAATGLGGLGIIGAIVYYFLTGQVPQNLGTTGHQPAGNQTSLIDTCKTGDDANKNTECWMVATAESLDAYWGEALASSTGVRYKKPDFVLFSGSTSTACGTASSQTGPFYCPADKSVYLDVSFFKELQSRYGATNSTLAQAYIVAHEFGHSIQDQTGILAKINHKDTGPNGSLVRSELQADCLAGVWLHNASKTVDPESGQKFLVPPTREQLKTSVDAAAAVGDDHIYESAGMEANQESFTHGSSAKRTEWLMKGYEGGKFESCDTWSVATP